MIKDFRNKSFFKFFKDQKQPVGMWLIAVFGLIMASVLGSFELYNKQFPVLGIFLIISFFGIILLLNSYSYITYKESGKILGFPDFRSARLVENIRVYIKNFDLYSSRTKFPPSTCNTIYDFEQADIILKDNSVTLLGKSDTFIIKGYAFPVELLLFGKPAYFNYAKIISVKELIDERLEFTINDPNYRVEFGIVFEKNEEIKLWLTNAKAHKNVL